MDSPNILAYTTGINTVATILAEDLSDDQLALYAAVFSQIGDTLTTIAVLRILGKDGGGENE